MLNQPQTALPNPAQTYLPVDFSFETVAIQIVIGIILGYVLSWVYTHYGTVLSNREELAKVIPKILLTTVLIISVVKSSLALSLGLVGALSIVRFRTPIKEPEELAYLFIAIAIGVGLGANHIFYTVLFSSVIMLFVVVSGLRKSNKVAQNLFMTVSMPESFDGPEKENLVQTYTEAIREYTSSVDLRRYETSKESCEAVFFITPKDASSLDSIAKSLRTIHPDASITFIDQNRIMGL